MTIGVVFATAFTLSAAAQDFMAQLGAPASVFPKPDRPVADIVSPIWHDEKERDDAGEPGQLVRLLEIKSGRTVADIGAGSGYYVVRLSPIVGSKGRIIAEDIVAKYLQSLRKRVRNLGLRNVVISLGEPHNPKLPPRSVDIAILVHMYHEIEQPYAPLYISSPRSSLKRASALSTDSPQHQSTVPHQVFCVARSLPLAIVRSVSIDLSAAMPISRFLRHRP
jgi:SAM-dependent methyltransferase